MKQTILARISLNKTMIKEQAIIAIDSLKIKEKIAIFSLLTILMVYLPTVIRLQPVTGALVNMSLILAVFLIGFRGAILLGIMPSLFALASGLLSPYLLPMIPFIIMGNVILAAIYHYLGRNNFSAAIFAAAFAKFLFLYASFNLLISFLPEGKQMLPLVSMMGWTQFLTAVSGGILAYGMLLFVKKTEIIK